MTVDDVKVEREKVVVASAGEGVKYTITFIGDLVRGNVPELVVTDLAVDGCSDAEDAADRYVFSADASWAATTYQTPFVPMWKMQTTAPIAYDATAATVQAALNALNGAINGGMYAGGGVTVSYSTGSDGAPTPLMV